MNSNPFLATLVIPYIRVVKRDVSLMTEVSGLGTGDYFDVEQHKTTKVYRFKENFAIINKLRNNAVMLLFWMLYYTPENADYVKLNELELCKVLDCSDRAVQRMKAELIKHAILAKRQANEYWINPVFFCTGNRIEMYKAQAMMVLSTKQRL